METKVAITLRHIDTPVIIDKVNIPHTGLYHKRLIISVYTYLPIYLPIEKVRVRKYTCGDLGFRVFLRNCTRHNCSTFIFEIGLYLGTDGKVLTLFITFGLKLEEYAVANYKRTKVFNITRIEIPIVVLYSSDDSTFHQSSSSLSITNEGLWGHWYPLDFEQIWHRETLSTSRRHK